MKTVFRCSCKHLHCSSVGGSLFISAKPCNQYTNCSGVIFSLRSCCRITRRSIGLAFRRAGYRRSVRGLATLPQLMQHNQSSQACASGNESILVIHRRAYQRYQSSRYCSQFYRKHNFFLINVDAILFRFKAIPNQPPRPFVTTTSCTNPQSQHARRNFLFERSAIPTPSISCAYSFFFIPPSNPTMHLTGRLRRPSGDLARYLSALRSFSCSSFLLATLSS